MKCLKCDKETKNPKFCSNSCAASVNNKGVRRFGVGRYVKCLNCNKIKNRNIGKFCSVSCHKEYQFLNETIIKFKNNELGNSPSAIKKCLIYLNGNICIKCGNNGVHNNEPLVLQMDHIDGNSDNNSISNLRLLCPNCHSQTPTYKSKNKSSARSKYRKRYYKGL